MVIVLDANAELIPKSVATRPTTSIPREDFLRGCEGVAAPSKRNISMLTPCDLLKTSLVSVKGSQPVSVKHVTLGVMKNV